MFISQIEPSHFEVVIKHVLLLLFEIRIRKKICQDLYSYFRIEHWHGVVCPTSYQPLTCIYIGPPSDQHRQFNFLGRYRWANTGPTLNSQQLVNTRWPNVSSMVACQRQQVANRANNSPTLARRVHAF